MTRLAKTIYMMAYLAAGSVVLSWVALFNRAPLVFSDTMSYATSAFEGEVPGLFSVFYSIFMLPLHLGLSFWPVVFVQGAIITHLLYLTMRSVSHGKLGKTDALIVLMVLAMFSSLPWLTGELLPDVFTAVVLLGIFLFAFEKDEMGWGEKIYLGALTTVAITTHLSHVPIAAGLILLCIAIRIACERESTGFGGWIIPLGVPFAIALTLMLAVNLMSSRQLVLARNSNVFLLANWIDQGPALSYLKDSCPQRRYALCAYIPELEGKSRDALKWSADSPFNKIGTFDELEPEARDIVRGTLASHPTEIIRSALRDMLLQFSRFGAGDGLTPDFSRWVGEHVGRIYGPDVGAPFLHSRQAQGDLPINEFRKVHSVALAASAVVWIWLIVLRKGGLPRSLRPLFAYISGALLWSATVTAVLSGAYDRYFARIIWLFCFVALIGVLQATRLPPEPCAARGS